MKPEIGIRKACGDLSFFHVMDIISLPTPLLRQGAFLFVKNVV